MAHLSKEDILRACEGGWSEVERLAAHLLVCRGCRARAAGTLKDRTAAKRPPILKAVTDLAAFDREMATERLLAKAELTELQRLTRGAQRERVILTRSCHSADFVDAMINALCSPRPRDEAESLANLAALAAQAIAPAEASEAFKNDLLARVWTEAANARRIRGEWQHARTALLRAGDHHTNGTGDLRIKARWLSIAGSLHCDQGNREQGLAALEECRNAYSDCGEWPLVGHTLVKMAHCVADDEPGRALVHLDRAEVYISKGDRSLLCHAAQIRTDCLVTVGRLEDALRAFAEAERLRPRHARPSLALRSSFFAARLLEALGHAQEAEALFDSVVVEELDRGHYKDAALDLVYVLGFHLRLGASDKAADLGQRTLGELDRRDSPPNEQVRQTLARLVEAARGQLLDEGMLRAAREQIRTHWSRPAAGEPKPAGARPATLPHRSVAARDPKLVEPLLARARWSSLRRKTRREQQAQVARSAEYHTDAFVELLLTDVRQATSRDEAEFTANLVLHALAPLGASSRLGHDLQAQLWTEVANVRRIACEWSKAAAALLQAGKHLVQGSGDPLLKARERSIAASLSADQGRGGEALAALEECMELYEAEGAWPLVARTLVKMAHTLMDTDPPRSLALIAQALPLLPGEDMDLRCHADNIRTDCLISLGEIDAALQAFDEAEPLGRAGASPAVRRRSDFFTARLLEHLGHPKEAVQLFEAVIADGFDHEAYREAFLDLLYLFGVHVRLGEVDQATALCRLAIERLDLYGLGHEKLRTVWQELMVAAQRQTVQLEALVEVRQLLKAHWRSPESHLPRLSWE